MLETVFSFQQPLTQRLRTAYSRQAYQFLQKRKIKAFYTLLESESFSEGARCLMQVGEVLFTFNQVLWAEHVLKFFQFCSSVLVLEN